MSAFALSGLRVESIDGSRFANALEFFKEGKTLEFENTVFVLDLLRGRLDVVKIAEHGIESIDAAGASAEISQAIEVYEHVRENSVEFAGLVAGLSPRFSLVHDYGTGSVEVCHLHNGKLVRKLNA